MEKVMESHGILKASKSTKLVHSPLIRDILGSRSTFEMLRWVGGGITPGLGGLSPFIWSWVPETAVPPRHHPRQANLSHFFEKFSLHGIAKQDNLGGELSRLGKQSSRGHSLIWAIYNLGHKG